MANYMMRVPPIPEVIRSQSESRRRQPTLLQWKRPDLPGYVVVNCDGSFRARECNGGYGIIVRNCYGQFILAKSSHFQIDETLTNIAYGTMVLMIEMMAIRDGLRLARRLELSHVEIQSDSKTAISVIAGHSKCPGECISILSEIRSEMPFFRGLAFMFVFRERNRAADFLSKFLTSDGEKCMDSSELPDLLRRIITEDGLGLGTLRF